MADYSMTMLVCADVARARDFYRDVVQLPLTTDAAPHWVDFDLGGAARLGLHPSAEHMPVSPGSMSLGFRVPDVDAFVARARGLGARVVQEPHQQDFGRLAILADPDGYAVQVATITS